MTIACIIIAAAAFEVGRCRLASRASEQYEKMKQEVFK